MDERRGNNYIDTHGVTDTNFAAFAMFGKRFSPRIMRLHKQAIFYIEAGKDYGPLSVLLEKTHRLLPLEWITEQ